MAGQSGEGGYGSTPIPDPTRLTSEAVNETKRDLRAEIQVQREILETRMGGIDALIGSIVRQIGEINTTLTQEIRDAATERGADIHEAIQHLKDLHEERFNAIQQQFNERDVRGEQEKKTAQEALSAALLAQKESVSQQNDANTTAATKSETSFTKQIDQIGTLIATLEKSLTDRITELKERIDRGEGQTSGGQQYRSDSRLDAAAATALIGSNTAKHQALTATYGAILASVIAVITVVAFILANVG